MYYVNKLMICLLQRAPEEGLIPEIYRLCSSHDILKTICNMRNYTLENIKHIPLRIEQYSEAVPNNSMKSKSNDDEDSVPKCLKIPPEPKIRPCSIHWITIHRDNKCQQVRVLLDS
jgi:hypothetical protein